MARRAGCGFEYRNVPNRPIGKHRDGSNGAIYKYCNVSNGDNVICRCSIFAVVRAVRAVVVFTDCAVRVVCTMEISVGGFRYSLRAFPPWWSLGKIDRF